MLSYNISSECAATSVGPANQLLLSLFHILATAQCQVSPPELWPPDHGEEVLKEGFSNYDFIVVGSGSAGTIVASRLSEIKDWKVLLLEAGGDPPIESQVPVFAFHQLKTAVDWQFHSYPPTACRIAGGCYMPRGKMLGGTSSINSMNFIRGIPQDFDEWADVGNNGWSYEDILPYFKKYEGNQNEKLVANDGGKFHNADGPIKINSGPTARMDKQVMELLKEYGLNYVEDINADKDTLGYFLLQKYNFEGVRSSTANAFLANQRNRANLHVMKYSYVDRILLDENNVAYGVELTYKGKHKLTVNCTKEVIVSAGAIQSPTLLMRSGIGPKKHLEERNIPCKADLSVGENFMDHASTFVMFKYTNFTSKPPSPLGLQNALYRYLLYDMNALGTTSVLSANIDTTNQTGLPDIHLGFSNFPQQTQDTFIKTMNVYTGLDSINDFIISENRDSALLFMWIATLKPKSRGFIRLNETLQEDIVSNLLTNEDDKATLVRGINYTINLSKSDAFQKIGTKLLRIDLKECDTFEYLSNEYWECYIKYLSNSIGHQSGTSKMGTDSKSVVNPELKVYNTTGLRQIDCGVIPIIPRGFTNGVVMMIAEKGADLIKKTYNKLPQGESNKDVPKESKDEL